MARYDELPVYRASYELLIDIFNLVKDFKREYKYTIGEKLKDETLDMLIYIYRANVSKEKYNLLQKARENVEIIRLLLRLLRDLRQIGVKKFVKINNRIENVSKQFTGWQRSVN